MALRYAVLAALIAFAPFSAHAQYLDGLPVAGSVSPADIVPICQGGVALHPGTCTTRGVTTSLLGLPAFPASGGAITGNVAITGTMGVTGATTVGGTTITGFGTGIGQAFGPFVNFQGSGLPGIFPSSRLIFQRSPTHFNDVLDFQFNREATFTGGTSANINSAMGITTDISAGDGSQEWNLRSIVNSSGTTGSGLPVATYSQGNRLAGGKDPIWAEILDVKDQSDQSSATSGAGALIAAEWDISANGADDAVSTATWGGHGLRKLFNPVMARYNRTDTTPTEFSNGIWWTQSDQYEFMDSVIGFAINVQIGSALDTRGAIPPTGSSNPVTSVMMQAGQVIDFKGGATLLSAPGRTLSYNSTAKTLQYSNGTASEFTVDDNGVTHAAKAGIYSLLANTASVTPLRMTTDGAAAGASNCVNLPANSAFGMAVKFTAVDTAAPANVVSYNWVFRMLSKSATNASMVLTGSTGPDTSLTAGTGSTYAVALTTDTTNGCLSMTVTAPNTDAWHAVARVDTDEAD